jgi:hypothetical protein
MSFKLVFSVTLLCAAVASAETIATEQVTNQSPKNAALEIKLGSYRPLIDSDPALGGQTPYADTFGGDMLLFEIEGDRQIFQKFGSAAVGFSIGYAEKYGWATAPAGSTSQVAERTALFVLPLKLMGVYRLDVAAVRYGVPLVPYVKLGLAYTPWWITKGGGVEFANGRRGAGGNWGYTAVLGLSVMLDFFDPRLARDFDSDLGVNHSYLFAEYVHEDVNDFGNPQALNLSSRHWMFGLTLEY